MTISSSSPILDDIVDNNNALMGEEVNNKNNLPLLERIKQLDATYQIKNIEDLYVPFIINGTKNVGQVHRSLLKMLIPITMKTTATTISNDDNDNNRRDRGSSEAVFQTIPPVTMFSGDNSDDNNHIIINSVKSICLFGETSEELTTKLDVVTGVMIEKGIIRNRHGDLYPIFDEEDNSDVNTSHGVLCTINRRSAPYFGITSRGVHLLCYVRRERKLQNESKSSNGNNNGDGENVSLWMAQRSKDKAYYPLMWDPTVAGGQPIGLSLKDNMIKEANEEAGIEPVLASSAKSVGCLSIMTCKSNSTCMKQSLYYIWDLDVTNTSSGTDNNTVATATTTFVPHPKDGEVGTFELWTCKQLENEVRYGNKLRPSQRLVIVDFLIRHGIITPDTEKDYSKILSSMHRDRLVLSAK